MHTGKNWAPNCADMQAQQQIFSHLKVVELAGVLAGPSVGHFFAELGAKVVKVENPHTKGDVTRSWKLKSEDPQEDTSAYFWSVNTLKEFISLDLTKSSDLDKLCELLKDADVLITNYKGKDDEKLKVDHKSIIAINPRIIYASITGFSTAPTRPAYDLILQAESGFMFMNGEAGSKALKMPVALIDILASHQLKEAILIALLERERTGKGRSVSVSLFQSAIASLANQATNWLIGKQLPVASGSLHPNIAPYGELFDTRDKQLITFAIGSNKQFRGLCEVIEYPALCATPRFASNHLRVANRNELYALLYNYIKKIDYESLYRACLEKEVPMGKIRNLKEVFELDEAAQMVRTYKYKDREITNVSSIAFRIGDES